MFSAILALLTLPYLDLSNLRGNPFKPLMKVSFLIFVANFFILMKLVAYMLKSLSLLWGKFLPVFILAVPIKTLAFKNNPYKG